MLLSAPTATVGRRGPAMPKTWWLVQAPVPVFDASHVSAIELIESAVPHNATTLDDPARGSARSQTLRPNTFSLMSPSSTFPPRSVEGPSLLTPALLEVTSTVPVSWFHQPTQRTPVPSTVTAHPLENPLPLAVLICQPVIFAEFACA